MVVHRHFPQAILGRLSSQWNFQSGTIHQDSLECILWQMIVDMPLLVSFIGSPLVENRLVRRCQHQATTRRRFWMPHKCDRQQGGYFSCMVWYGMVWYSSYLYYHSLDHNVLLMNPKIYSSITFKSKILYGTLHPSILDNSMRNTSTSREALHVLQLTIRSNALASSSWWWVTIVAMSTRTVRSAIYGRK